MSIADVRSREHDALSASLFPPRSSVRQVPLRVCGTLPSILYSEPAPCVGNQQQIAVIALCNVKDKVRSVLRIVPSEMNIVHKMTLPSILYSEPAPSCVPPHS